MELFGAAAALFGLAEETAVVGESMALLANEVRAEGATLIGQGGRAAYEAIATELESGNEMAEFQQALKTGARITAAAGTAGVIADQTRKGVKRKRTESQSPAQEPGSRRRAPNREPGQPGTPMPPRGVSTSTHWYDRTKKKWVKRKRPLRKKRAFKKKRPQKRFAKKKKTVKRKYMRALGSTKYGTHGLISRHEVSYFGFAANGGRDEFLHGAADAILRAWAGKFNCVIQAPESNWNYSGTNSVQPRCFQVFYRRSAYVNFGAEATVAGTKTRLDNDSHADMTDVLAKELRTQARTGYMPYFAILYEDTAGTTAMYRDAKFGDMLVNVTSSMVIKLRNLTHPDSDDSHRLTTLHPAKNPLTGYAYEFYGEFPMVKDVLIGTASTAGTAVSGADNMKKFHHRDNTRGIIIGPQGSVPGNTTDEAGRDDDDGMNDGTDTGSAIAAPFDGYMAKPPIGSTVFKNCKKSTKIVMPVSKEFTHKMTCKFSGTLTALMLKYNSDNYRPAHIGNCFMLGLVQKFPNSKKILQDHNPTTGPLDGHDDVTVEYDVQTVIRAGARIARAEKTPAEVKLHEINCLESGI